VLNERHKKYLEAMGIDVWSLRGSSTVGKTTVKETVVREPAELTVEVVAETPVESPGLKLGPGRDGVLLVCARDSDSASKLANDINRALGGVPVWAWPDDDPGAVTLANAVEENLFTTVAIFGDELTQMFFAGDVPANPQYANLVRLPAMQEIRDLPGARRMLWAALCRSGMVSSAQQ